MILVEFMIVVSEGVRRGGAKMPEPHAGDLTPLGRHVRMAFFGEPTGNARSLAK
jgi:hypothetical protein